ncbi:MAG: PucR family transcriptional regulator [Chloroflexota bacterium]
MGQFQRVAEAVTERTAELLSAEVSVVDGYGSVIASSKPNNIGLRRETLEDEFAECLRVPLHLETASGEIIVSQPTSGEIIPPRLAHVLVELMISQTAVVDQLPNQHELKNKFIHDLLHGAIGDEAAILREAQVLGMDLAPPRAVILIDAAEYILQPPRPGSSEDPEASIRRRGQLLIGGVVDFFELPNDTICAYIGNGEVAVLKASNRRALADWVDTEDGLDQTNPSWAHLGALKRAGEALLRKLASTTRSPISISIGRYHPGLKGLAASYADARAALSLGRRFHGQNQVHCLDALGIASFVGVADEATKMDLATYLLSPLDHNPGLLETLNEFFDSDCSPSASSEALHIHRNTLGYRLDKIQALTGLDPRSFDDAVQMRLATVLRTLQTSADCASA